MKFIMSHIYIGFIVDREISTAQNKKYHFKIYFLKAISLEIFLLHFSILQLNKKSLGGLLYLNLIYQMNLFLNTMDLTVTTT